TATSFPEYGRTTASGTRRTRGPKSSTAAWIVGPLKSNSPVNGERSTGICECCCADTLMGTFLATRTGDSGAPRPTRSANQERTRQPAARLERISPVLGAAPPAENRVTKSGHAVSTDDMGGFCDFGVWLL